mgnify:FL=1|jgi:hypothetical protein
MKELEAWMNTIDAWQIYVFLAVFFTVVVMGKELIYPYKKSNGRGK